MVWDGLKWLESDGIYGKKPARRPSVHRCGGARDVLGPASPGHHRCGLQPILGEASGGVESGWKEDAMRMRLGGDISWAAKPFFEI